MRIWTTVEEARRHRQQARGRVALVPTMGALHEGHLRLVEEGRRLADTVFVSIFVNPTQFGPGEDLDHYPRTLEEDLRLCEAAQVAGVFTPSVQEMYPPEVIDAAVDVPDLTSDLEGAWRPGHFNGVCRVVLKLLNIFQPDLAMFGEKDYQQLRVVQAMVADLMLPTRIVPVPTVREPDGLAMSSRNRYLDEPQRRKAVGLYKALKQAQRMVEEDQETDPLAVERAMRQVLEVHHVEVDYAVVRHPHTLKPLDCIEPKLTDGVVALIAGRLDGVRLIDNMVLGHKRRAEQALRIA